MNNNSLRIIIIIIISLVTTDFRVVLMFVFVKVSFATVLPVKPAFHWRSRIPAKAKMREPYHRWEHVENLIPKSPTRIARWFVRGRNSFKLKPEDVHGGNMV